MRACAPRPCPTAITHSRPPQPSAAPGSAAAGIPTRKRIIANHEVLSSRRSTLALAVQPLKQPWAVRVRCLAAARYACVWSVQSQRALQLSSTCGYLHQAPNASTLKHLGEDPAARIVVQRATASRPALVAFIRSRPPVSWGPWAREEGGPRHRPSGHVLATDSVPCTSFQTQPASRHAAARAGHARSAWSSASGAGA